MTLAPASSNGISEPNATGMFNTDRYFQSRALCRECCCRLRAIFPSAAAYYGFRPSRTVLRAAQLVIKEDFGIFTDCL